MSEATRKACNQNASSDLLDWGVRSQKAVPGSSPGRGRGLFAAARIARGEIVERACTVFISAEQAKALDAMQPLGDFYFEHPRAKEEGLMVLGMASLCNHADQPNAHVRFIDGGPCGWIAELYALDDIPAGAEITYKYRCALWFQEVQ
ncbi:MAG: SET domain-containing protein-lysine N-methyltransferase [Alphaproteobacteria bacterium]|nr:SET domain-containing protein-lysine N-methyltransferase [Alphaproteobacteria bacterium]